MNKSMKIYSLLFLLIFVVSLVGGYIAASSLHLKSFQLPDVFSRLATVTPTLGSVATQPVTPRPSQAITVTAVAVIKATNTPPIPTVYVPTVSWTTPTRAPGMATTIPGLPTVSTTLTPPISATGAIELPTATPTRPSFEYRQDGGVAARPEKGCAVGAVFGTVRDENGNPLAGVQIRLFDAYNHTFLTMTKQPPDTGYYDFIIGTNPATYYAVVIDAQGSQISPVVTIDHKEGSAACWYEVNFQHNRRLTTF